MKNAFIFYITDNEHPHIGEYIEYINYNSRSGEHSWKRNSDRNYA